jgi:hypothetical protein
MKAKTEALIHRLGRDLLEALESKVCAAQNTVVRGGCAPDADTLGSIANAALPWSLSTSINNLTNQLYKNNSRGVLLPADYSALVALCYGLYGLSCSVQLC